jgi:predicted nucleic acid-binding protein
LPTFLLDTNIIVDVLNEKRGRRERLLTLVSQGNLLACCPINISEVYAGMRPPEERATCDFLRSLEFYTFDWQSARMAGLLKRDYARKGITLSLPDTAIAAIALLNNLTLITDNVKDFPMKDLSLFQLPEA